MLDQFHDKIETQNAQNAWKLRTNYRTIQASEFIAQSKSWDGVKGEISRTSAEIVAGPYKEKVLHAFL